MGAPFDLKLVKNQAEAIARKCGFSALPVCPKTIAAQHDIAVQAKPDTEKGVSGMLIQSGDDFGILYATHVDNEGFQRFSIAHELGHYFLSGHPDAVLRNGVHASRAGFEMIKDKYEREADTFAAALLMPEDAFKRALRSAGGGVDAVMALADLCNTSLSATAFRFAELTDRAVAVALTHGSTILACVYSDKMKTVAAGARLPWLNGLPVPYGTATAELQSSAKRISAANRIERHIDLDDWFGVCRGIRATEDVIGLGSYERTLTVISCDAKVDDDFDSEDQADDEGYLRDRWAPRFHR